MVAGRILCSTSPATIQHGDAMSADIINLQARARLIREAREAREKRKQARDCLTIEDTVKVKTFPGGIDDMDLS